MLSVQRQLFTGDKQDLGMKFLGDGYMSKVWAHPDGETVIKRCRADDLTLAWLYWCKHQPTLLPGMPEVYSLVLLGDGPQQPNYENDLKGGYVATMRRYVPCWSAELNEDSAEDLADFKKVAYKDGKGTRYQYAIERFTAAVDAVFDCSSFGDLHGENYMWDSGRQCVVITDPGACTIDRSKLYQMLPNANDFQLEPQ